MCKGYINSYCVSLGPLRRGCQDRMKCARGHACERKWGRSYKRLRWFSDQNASLMLRERDGSLSKRVLRKLRTMQSKETSARLLGTPWAKVAVWEFPRMGRLGCPCHTQWMAGSRGQQLGPLISCTSCSWRSARHVLLVTTVNLKMLNTCWDEQHPMDFKITQWQEIPSSSLNR